jgi:hypothetical protein
MTKMDFGTDRFGAPGAGAASHRIPPTHLIEHHTPSVHGCNAGSPDSVTEL